MSKVYVELFSLFENNTVFANGYIKNTITYDNKVLHNVDLEVLVENLLFSKINFGHINSFLGTNKPIWLRGDHPENVNDTKKIELCEKQSSGCCVYQLEGYVKNCSSFFVYKLPPAIACPSSYCAG